MTVPKVKKCIVNLNRVSLNSINIAEVQEQMSVRRCCVRIKRLKEEPAFKDAMAKEAGYKLRRCYIRLPRLPLVEMRPDNSPVPSLDADRSTDYKSEQI